MKLAIKRETDIAKAVQYGLLEAGKMGFTKTKKYMIATAVSELARNILVHAKTGSIYIETTIAKNRKGLEVLAVDSGPGIEDIELALQDNYSTANSLGIGLPGTRRLMDDFEISSKVGKGTKVLVKKWL